VPTAWYFSAEVTAWSLEARCTFLPVTTAVRTTRSTCFCPSEAANAPQQSPEIPWCPDVSSVPQDHVRLEGSTRDDAKQASTPNKTKNLRTHCFLHLRGWAPTLSCSRISGMLPQPRGLAAEFGSGGQFSSSSRSLRALSSEDLRQLASLQGVFLSWSKSCACCPGSLSKRRSLQWVWKPVRFFSLTGSFGARITWFQTSFSY